MSGKETIVGQGIYLWMPAAEEFAPECVTRTAGGAIQTNARVLVDRLFDAVYAQRFGKWLQDGRSSFAVPASGHSKSRAEAVREVLRGMHRYVLDGQRGVGKRLEVFCATSRTPGCAPCYLVVVGTALHLPAEDRVGHVTFPAHIGKPPVIRMRGRRMSIRARLLAPVKWMVSAALLVPIFGLCVFFEVEPEGSHGILNYVHDYLVLNVQYAIVLAVLGAIVGFLIGTVRALRGQESPE